MKICQECHGENTEDAKFCAHCGKSFSEQNAAKLPVNGNPQRTSYWIYGLIIAISVLVIGSGVVIYKSKQLTGKDPKPAVSATETSTTTAQKLLEEVPSVADKKVSLPYKNGSTMGLLDDKLSVISEAVAPHITNYNDFGMAIAWGEGGDYHLIDMQGKTQSITVTAFKTEMRQSSPELFSKNGSITFYQQDSVAEEARYGLLDAEGKVIIEPQGRMISDFNGRAITYLYETASYGKCGILLEDGTVLIEPIYASLQILGEGWLAAKLNDTDKYYSLLDIKGNVILEDFSLSYPYAVTPKKDIFVYQATNGKYGLINNRGKIVMEACYSQEPLFSGNGQYCVVKDELAQLQHLYTLAGKEVYSIDSLYSISSVSNEGICSYSQPYKCGLLDRKGKPLFEVDVTSDYCYFYPLLEDAAVYVLQTPGYSAPRIFKKNGEELFLNEEIILDSELTPNLDQPQAINGLIHLQKKNRLEDGEQYLLNSVGTQLSDQALYYSDLGEQVFIQEPRGVVKIVEKKTGKVLLSKTLEVAE